MRFIRIFLRYIFKYFWGFITVFLCGLLSLSVMENRVERMLIERVEISSRAGIRNISSGIDRMDVICRMLYQSSKFEGMVNVQGESTGQEIVGLKDMKEELSEIDILVDEFAYVFAIFPDNNLYLSSSQSNLYFDDYYGRFLEVELDGQPIVSGTELKETLVRCYMNGQHFVGLDSIRYNGLNGECTLQDAVLYLSYDNVYTISDPNYLLCFVLDYDWLTQNILAGNIDAEDDGFYHIIDTKTGEELISYGTVPEKVSEYEQGQTIRGRDKEYYLITEDLKKADWQIAIGISMSEIKEMVSSARLFLVTYVCFGLLVVLILTCYYSVKRYFGFRYTMSLFPDSLGGIFDMAHDEYEVVGNRVLKLLENGEDDRKIIEELKLQNQAIMLEHLIVNGIKSPKERNICEKYFGREPEFFCVTLAELGTDDIALQEELVLYMVNFLDIKGISLMAQVHTGVSDELFLIEVTAHQDANVDNIKNIFKELAAEITEKYNVSLHVGISAIGTGFDNMNRCYEQARQLVSAQNLYEGETVVEAYGIFANTLYENPVDLEFLNRLHTLLLCGQKEDIYKALDKIEGYYTRMPYQYEQQKEQIFYSIRNIFHIAALQFNCKEILGDAQFKSDIQCRQMMELFRKSADLLCNYVLGKRKSRNEELKDTILDYLQQNYQNPDLSAGMVCQDIGIAEKYLFQFLKEQTGETFASLLLHLRIECAKDCLLNTDYSNEQIAAMSGFSSVNTFYRNFKKVVGVTPNVFKENGR